MSIAKVEVTFNAEDCGMCVFVAVICLYMMDVSVCEYFFFFFSSRRRHTRFDCDWSSDVCSSDLAQDGDQRLQQLRLPGSGGPGDQAVRAVRAQVQDERPVGADPDRHLGGPPAPRSEERRVGKECRSRWSPYH